MHVLYEEEGDLKAGTVLGQAPASFQVESLHGRRTKVRAGNVLLTFEQPAAGELLAQAQRLSQEMDVDFLWQCSGGAEFDFKTLARDYVGREPTPVSVRTRFPVAKARWKRRWSTARVEPALVARRSASFTCARIWSSPTTIDSRPAATRKR